MLMIKYAKKAYSMVEVCSMLNRYVAAWLKQNFNDLSPPQKYAIPLIHQGKNVLVSSPTGSGKTLTAFISILSKLFDLAEKNRLEDKVYCVYISPLRALSNDIHRNLEVPLEEISKMLGNGIKIRHSVRTGDTSAQEKQKMLRRPPHILITTPESLAIMLNAPKFRDKLRPKWVIIDEIHSLCESKRGTHLSLTLERMQYWQPTTFVRIGLSATISPIEEVARFLVGYENGEERDCYIVDVSFIKKKDLKVLAPVRDLICTQTEKATGEMYRMLYDMIKKHKTTLVFTNTRSGTERVVFHLKQVMPKMVASIDQDDIAAHHGSLSRDIRFDVEENMKKGRLKAVVSSTSLELGIDIGYVDLVVQIGSPKSVTRCLQRIGRSGHKLHAKVKGYMLCLDRDDLVECGVMVREAYKNHLDKAIIPKKPLDVLAQHIMGMAINKKWSVGEALNIIRQAYPYRNLTKEELQSVLRFLSGSYSELEEYKVYGKIWYSSEEGVFGRRGKYARVIYALNLGTIPDEVMIKVYDGKRKVGSIEEEFLERLSKGDKFVLGGRVYEFVSARGVKAKVRPAFDSKPTVPAWFSEQLPLSFDLAKEIGKFREWMFSEIGKRERSALIEYIERELHTNRNAAEIIYDYFREQYLYMQSLGCKHFPTDTNIMIEISRDELGRQVMIFHTLFGRRVNDALARAYAYLAGKKLRRNVGVVITDNGFMLVLPRPLKDFRFIKELKKANIREILSKVIVKTEMMKRRFRHVANRSLMILRNYKGHEIKVSKQQISAATLMKVASEIAGFPVIKETIREIAEDMMDVINAEKVLESIENNKRRFFFINTEQSLPTPFSHNIMLTGLSDIVLMEDRRALLERYHREIMKRIKKEIKN
ncbi:MAG: ATP-dependent helicase [Candidatus Aenigmatarchaeota archaeon]|nr:MAG: ATP-dependent helicase [Candidatus Aenigmarchaeota archaeon]